MTEETTTPKTRKPRATKQVAETAPVDNVSIEEAVVDQTVITGPEQAPSSPASNMHSNPEGVVGSQVADRTFNKLIDSDPAPVVVVDGMTAVYSAKNLRWSEVGTLTKGYNIVTKEAAEKWLTLAGTREATPEEVATYYGV